ncbi:hypothetical protein ACFYYN_20240 [Streptomyces sp. NPDC001902]
MSHPTQQPTTPDTTLGDLLPALRWGDPRQLDPVLGDPRLPDTWWLGAPLADAVATVTAQAVAHRAAAALRTYWPYLSLDAAMPSLRFCLEGQEQDLSATIQQTVADMPIAQGDEILGALVRAQLRSFEHIGRTLHTPGDRARADGPRAVGDASDISAQAEALLRALPAAAPPHIKEAAEALYAWAHAKPAASDQDDQPEASPADTAEPAPLTVEHALLGEPLAILDELVGGWDERQLAIAETRLFGTERIPLEILGQQFSVTRERIRQIQITLEEQFQDWLRTGAGRPFHGHLLAVQDLLGPVATEAELQHIHAQHPLTVPGLKLPLWQLVASCLPDRQWNHGWVLQGDLRDRQEQTRLALLARCEKSPLPWPEAVTLLGDLGIREQDAQAWLEDLTGFRQVDGHLLPWGRSVNERAEAILTLAGQPLSTEELRSRLDDGTALASLRNQLQADERFMRRDRDVYGLRRWGGIEYLGIREMIVRELEAAGGEASSEDIVTALCAQFDVQDKSIRAYLSGPGFERHRRGWVRLAAPDVDTATDYQPRRDVSHTRRCFQTGQGIWWYRIDVTREHLRGSGFPVPMGFAVHLGLTPGNKLELTHQAGEVVLAWGNQPHCGSLRPLLNELHAVEGDHVFLAAKDGALRAQRIPHEPEHLLSDMERALRLMALAGQVAETEMPAVLGRRIGLADATTMQEVHAHLRVRGDKDILSLLESQQEDPDATQADAPDLPAETAPVHAPAEPADRRRNGAAAAQFRRDPAWDEEIIPLLNDDFEAQHIALAQALAARGKAAPVFGYELGDSGWLADFAWQDTGVKIAVLPEPDHQTTGEAEQRDAAYRAAGWTARTAGQWLVRLDELAAALPDTTPES